MNIENKFCCLSIYNPFETMKKLKGVFKPLKRCFRRGKEIYPPTLWVNKPLPITIVSWDVLWKDKYDTPRYEGTPFIWIHLFGYNFLWYWALERVEDYWEQALWYLYYYNTYSQGLSDKPNINSAKKGWPWTYYKSNETTWNDEFLIKSKKL